MNLLQLAQKQEKLVMGLMGGTSADGVDAALVKISGYGQASKLQLLGFASVPFAAQVRQEILLLAGGGCGGSRRLAKLSALLGHLYVQACQAACEAANIPTSQIDLIGSHGQTVYHQPEAQPYLGYNIATTLQIGEPSFLCEKFGAVVVSDFRVRDLAAGGQGAPLVPYSEYLIYSSPNADVALQNIGGIGNITFLPRGGRLSDIIAFDTGPGNMLMDAAVEKLTAGKQTYDIGGKLAAQYPVAEPLLAFLLQDEYLQQKPPKTTGREHYGTTFLQTVYQQAKNYSISDGEVLRTLTRFTAQTIADAMQSFLPRLPARLVVGGGGSYNKTLLADMQALLPTVAVLTNEDIGFNSDAKEAVAFAVLANEAVHGICNNVPSATGAAHPVVMGKISQ